MITMNENTYNYINLDYMDMMSDGDESMKKVMLEMLLEELPVEIDKMNQLLGASNWEELGSVSHKMKSTLAFVGNNEMTEANKQVELIAKAQDDLGTLPSLVATLVELTPKALTELQNESDRL
ncbi:MAG: Hpt domain-containing protein [Bacteroidota bacterium]